MSRGRKLLQSEGTYFEVTQPTGDQKEGLFLEGDYKHHGVDEEKENQFFSIYTFVTIHLYFFVSLSL